MRLGRISLRVQTQKEHWSAETEHGVRGLLCVLVWIHTQDLYKRLVAALKLIQSAHSYAFFSQPFRSLTLQRAVPFSSLTSCSKMPVFNVTGDRVFYLGIPQLTDYGSQVPDSSPLILYSGSWDDTPKSTTDYQLYQNQTYHLSSQRVRSALWSLQVSYLLSSGRYSNPSIQWVRHLHLWFS